jgi:hypothetical protein
VDLTLAMVLVTIVSVEYVSWLFREAWEHRRRRWRTVAWIGVAACAAAVLLYAIAVPGSAPRVPAGFDEPAGTITESPAVVFSQSPYMGVHCRVPNSIACDEVGLAIWLKRPADSVRASIDGRALVMDRFGNQLSSLARPRMEFDGYLRPAGVMSSMHVRPVPGTTSTWLGDPTPFASVWLLVSYRSGRYVATHLQVPLAAGWG